MRLLTLKLRGEQDLVTARSRAKQIAGRLGLNTQDQTRVATVVSELARNALRYGKGGTIEFSVDPSSWPDVLWIRVNDQGPGIPNLDQVLAGQYQSTTGMGVGLTGSRRLMDEFDVQTSAQEGTSVRVGKHLPTTVDAQTVTRLADELARTRPNDPVRELQAQNQELLTALSALAEREERLLALNAELEDTNRGVVALYGELEEKADRLREANQLKTMFLSYMSHEFRTPLNSILGLTRLLLDRLDGPLTPEQEKQVTLVQGATSDLLSMVNDLLDVAKVEAGKSEVRVTTFDVAQLFGTLRALFLPLAVNPAVRLVFDDPRGMPPMVSDEAKVGQILRNFISNALKFTEQGEVRVRASHDATTGLVTFSVLDTGVGIPEEEQPRLFQDFAQVHSPLVRRIGGTGLGLSLARKLSELLGGTVGMHSTPGVGSRFYATLPLHYPHARPATPTPGDAPAEETVPDSPALLENVPLAPVLIIDDNPTDRYLLRTLLNAEGIPTTETTGGTEGLNAARTGRYRVALLDLSMPDLPGEQVLRELRARPETRDLPVIIVTSQALEEQERQRLHSLGADVHSKERVFQGGGAPLVTHLKHLLARSAHD